MAFWVQPPPPPPSRRPVKPVNKDNERQTGNDLAKPRKIDAKIVETISTKRSSGKNEKYPRRTKWRKNRLIIGRFNSRPSSLPFVIFAVALSFGWVNGVEVSATPAKSSFAAPVEPSEGTIETPAFVATLVEASEETFGDGATTDFHYVKAKFVIPVHRNLGAKKTVTPTVHLENRGGESVDSDDDKDDDDDRNDQFKPRAVKKTVFERDVNFVENIGGKAGEGFYITLDIGTPPQRLNVLLDTGSSNFAIAGSFDFDVDFFFDRTKSSSLWDLGTRVGLKYTQGEWEGDLVSDFVSLTGSSSSSSSIKSRTPITLITSSSHFFLDHADWQGILGLAYPTLSRPDRNQPSFVDLLVEDNQLDNVFAIQLCGSTAYESNEPSSSSSSGHLAVGGVDSVAFKGNMFYTPIVREMYYEVVIADMDVGGKSIDVPCGVYNAERTIVDSGTTNLLIPDAAYDKLISSMRGETASPFWSPIPTGFWQRRELICASSGQIDFDPFPVVGISLFAKENEAFRLQLRPEQYLRAVGEYGPRGNCYKLSIAPSGDAGEKSGSILGAVLMEGFYVVFDKGGEKIGWAQNDCPNRGSAITATLSPPRPVNINITYCKAPTRYSFADDKETNERLMIASYVMGGIAIVLLTIIAFLLIEPFLCRRSKVLEEREERNQRDYEQLD